MINDFRYAFRSLVRQPTFTIVALLTLVLGIGTNTAIFSVIKAVLLNQLPYDDAARLVVLSERNPDGNSDLVAPLTFGDWQTASKTMSSIAAYRQLRYAFAGAGDPLDVPSVRATPNLFSVLRARAQLGRTFTAEEGVTGADHVAVSARRSGRGILAGRRASSAGRFSSTRSRTPLSASCRQHSIFRRAGTWTCGRHSVSIRATCTAARARRAR